MGDQKQILIRGRKIYANIDTHRPENEHYRLFYPTTDILFGWEEAAGAILTAIMNQQAAAAWDKEYTETTANTIQELSARFQDTVNRARIGTAVSHFKNATEKMDSYRTDPDPDPEIRKTQLLSIEDESGFAMRELETIGEYKGLFSLHTWLLSSELHMAVKQEWLVVHRTAGAQENINKHYDYMVQHFSETRDAFMNAFSYCITTINGVRGYFYCGGDKVHDPSEDENTAVHYVAITDGKVDKLSAIVHR